MAKRSGQGGKRGRMIYDVPEKNADLYYATRFSAPDPILFVQAGGRSMLLASDLEIDRAKREAAVDRVLSLSEYRARAAAHTPQPTSADLLHELFTELGVDTIEVPEGTSFALVDALRRKGYTVEGGPVPFFPERFSKSSEELRHMKAAQRTVFASMRLARDTLRKSRIKGRRLVYRGTTLTSERLRTMIDVFLLERGFQPEVPIVSCGKHALDPHDRGSGPLRSHDSIIVDIFPRSAKSWYCGDATRTFCRGRAPEALKKMYAVVRRGQQLGMERIRAGVNGRTVHEAILAFFAREGYPTGEKDGRQQGFFHGTGHGIGLEVHEEPARITQRDYTLKAGNVMSVEPGLYYAGIGGVRIEDLVVVTKAGCELLATFPKRLEIL